MNHDIAHCTGIKYEPKCDNCRRKKAHQELQSLVRRGKTATGQMYQYVNPDECEDSDFSMYWGDCAGAIHDQTDVFKKGGR